MLLVGAAIVHAPVEAIEPALTPLVAKPIECAAARYTPVSRLLANVMLGAAADPAPKGTCPLLMFATSYFVVIAVEIAEYSASKYAPLMTFAGSPERRASLAVKFVIWE
jgi:hypothetical protein